MRRLVIIVVATVVVLAGVVFLAIDPFGSGGGSLSGVTVSASKDKPSLKVNDPVTVDGIATRVLTDGDGAKVKKGDLVEVRYGLYNGKDGKVLDSSFESGTSTLLTLDPEVTVKGFVDGLVGQTVGSRILVGLGGKGAFGEQVLTQLGLKKGDTVVVLFDVQRVVPTSASGSAQEVPGTVPQIKFDDKDVPTGFVGDAAGVAPTAEEKAYVAIQGDGAEVKSGQSITVQYVGQVYPNGSVFDSSWTRGAPATFSIGTGQVIPCWDDLLVGQKLGTRVILTCPADKAYGDQGQGDAIKPGDTLIFAVDLLAAS